MVIDTPPKPKGYSKQAGRHKGSLAKANESANQRGGLQMRVSIAVRQVLRIGFNPPPQRTILHLYPIRLPARDLEPCAFQRDCQNATVCRGCRPDVYPRGLHKRISSLRARPVLSDPVGNAAEATF